LTKALCFSFIVHFICCEPKTHTALKASGTSHPDRGPIEPHHLLKTKTKGRNIPADENLQTAAANAWHSITKGEARFAVMSICSTLQ